MTTGTNLLIKLGMEMTIELTGAREETIYYRDKHKRIIDHCVVNESRWRRVGGPLLYAVTDSAGLIRYIGKWEGTSALYGIWFTESQYEVVVKVNAEVAGYFKRRNPNLRVLPQTTIVRLMRRNVK